MPVYRGIKISVISQYGAQALPEYSPARIFDHKTLSPAPDSSPALLDSTTHTATVYIPVFPSSMFWFRYHVYVPNAKYFYFKAYMNGKHLVSWGTGEINDFKGKVMFGLFENRSGIMPERQLLTFSDDASLEGQGAGPCGWESLEIRVYRSCNRLSTSEDAPTFVDNFSPECLDPDGGKLRNALALKPGGEVEYSHPTNRYQYALVDPLDTPYATFRWLPRTWYELDQLDVASLESEPGVRRSAQNQNSFETCNPEQSDEFSLNSRSTEAGLRTVLDPTIDDTSPLRVPVYQVPGGTIEPDRSPSRGTVRDRLAISESGSPKHLRADRVSLDQGSDPNPESSKLRRDHILESRSGLDRYAAAQPANRGTLLDSVVSQLMTAGSLHWSRPGSLDSKQALQEYLRRRSSEKPAPTCDEVPLLQPTAARPRALSWRAQIEGESVGVVKDIKDRPPTPFASLSPKVVKCSSHVYSTTSDGAELASPRSVKVSTIDNSTTCINPHLVLDRTCSLGSSRSSSRAEDDIESALESGLAEDAGAGEISGTTSDLISFGLRGGSMSYIKQRLEDEDYKREAAVRSELSFGKQLKRKKSWGTRLLERFQSSGRSSEEASFTQIQARPTSANEALPSSKSWRRIFRHPLKQLQKEFKDERWRSSSPCVLDGKLRKKE